MTDSESRVNTVPFWDDYTDDEIMTYALAALNDPEVLGEKAKAMLRARLDAVQTAATPPPAELVEAAQEMYDAWAQAEGDLVTNRMVVAAKALRAALPAVTPDAEAAPAETLREAAIMVVGAYRMSQRRRYAALDTAIPALAAALAGELG